MKKLCCLVGLCISMFVASAAAAEDYKEPSGTREGVDVMVTINPLGPNNQIAAYVKFVNNNAYKVNIKWTPIITCEGGDIKKGYGADFSMNDGASYEVTIWRSTACGFQDVKDITVETEVKRADIY
jgi:hypothetical protein